MKNKSKCKKIWRSLLLIFGCLLALALLIAGESFIPKNGGNPYSCFLPAADKQMIASLCPLNDLGNFYTAEYEGDYSPYAEFLARVLNLAAKPGCTAYTCLDESGELVTCRNYDCIHYRENGDASSVSVFLHTVGGDKYETYAVADAFWLSSLGLPFYEFAPSDGKTNLSLLSFLPFLCMDGINEKGLCVSILSVDIKEDETSVYLTENQGDDGVISVLLRRLLDHCADLEEAEEYARRFNLKNTAGNDYHLYVTDASGASAVFEWRYGQFTVTQTDVATNFYLAYDDAQDVIRDGNLVETFTYPASEALKTYRYGYGHGYGRFFTVAEALANAKTGGQTYAVLTEKERFALQKSVWQYSKGITSPQTVYSVQYHAESGDTALTLFSEPDTVYSFSFRDAQ